MMTTGESYHGSSKDSTNWTFEKSGDENKKSSKKNHSFEDYGDYREKSVSSTENSGSDQENISLENVLKSYIYITMELCQKESLKEWLSNNIHLGPIDRRQEALNIFQQICQGVDYIHSQKLIHRYLFSKKYQ